VGVFDFTYDFNSTGSPEMDEVIRQQLEHQRAIDEGRPPKSPSSRPRGGFATQGVPMFNDQGRAFALGGFGTAMGASAQQANTLQNMINQTTAAWSKEHDSRVAQAREMRRMQHEKDMVSLTRGVGRDQEIAQLRQLIAELRAQLARR